MAAGRASTIGFDAPSLKQILLPRGMGAVPPLAVSPMRGLACVMGRSRSCIIDLEADDGVDEG